MCRRTQDFLDTKIKKVETEINSWEEEDNNDPGGGADISSDEKKRRKKLSKDLNILKSNGKRPGLAALLEFMDYNLDNRDSECKTAMGDGFDDLPKLDDDRRRSWQRYVLDLLALKACWTRLCFVFGRLGLT